MYKQMMNGDRMTKLTHIHVYIYPVRQGTQLSQGTKQPRRGGGGKMRTDVSMRDSAAISHLIY